MNKQELVKKEILETIQESSCANPISLKELVFFTRLSRRHVKGIIKELRKDHPICSAHKVPCGYWYAKTNDEILWFIHQMTIAKNGYEETIQMMKNHLLD